MTPPNDIRGVRFVSRIIFPVLLGTAWAIGYFSIGVWTHQSRLFDPSTTLDACIPFVGWAVWPYLLGLVGLVLPAVIIQSRALFLRTVVAYATVMTLSFSVFILLPTDAAKLRLHASTFYLDSPTAWAVGTLYAIDPPTNMLPSLHVSLATAAALAVSEEYAGYRTLTFVGWAILAASVCAVKQHSVLDVLSGTILGLISFRVANYVTTCRRVLLAHRAKR
jgi:membrane-associated phospholipid phosphatase